MLTQLFRTFAMLCAGLLVTVHALAASLPFDPATFDARQKAGQATLVMVHTDWCPTCAVQEPVVSGLLSTPEFKSIQAQRIDFDKQAALNRRFKVSMQSTLILFKGDREVARMVGETRRQPLADFLRKAL